MKGNLLFTLNHLNYLTTSDIESIEGKVGKKKLEKAVNQLIIQNKVLLLKKEESKKKGEILVYGPGAEEVEGELLLQEDRRSLADIYWNKVLKRFRGDIKGEARELKLEAVKHYDSLENLEKRYFDLSIKYHLFYNYFFNLNLEEEVKGKIMIENFEEVLQNVQEVRELLEKSRE